MSTRRKRAREAVVGSIVAAASFASMGAAVAEEAIVVDGQPEACIKCIPGSIIILNDYVYGTWDDLAAQGVFAKLSDAVDGDTFIKIQASSPVVDLFAKIEIG